MATRPLFLFLLTSLLLLTFATSSVDDEEDLSFLDEPETTTTITNNQEIDSENEYSSDNEEDFSNYQDFDETQNEFVELDEKDVVVLKDDTFNDFVNVNKYAMVEFYAPWCGHCKSLAPEYAAAATEVLDNGVRLAKFDASVENEIAENYKVEAFPTLFFFVDGVHRPYDGPLTKGGIVTWIKKRIGPGVYNITTTEDAERVLMSEDKVVLGFFDSLVGPDSKEFAAASKLDDDVTFYQTSNPNIAKMFHLESDVKQPALVLLKKQAEKVSYFAGQVKKSAIAEFISANKLPLVNVFTRESASMIFENSIKKQVLLFATSNELEKVFSTFEEAAKSFKGKLIFVYVDVDNEEVGKPVADYFGVTGDTPKVLGYTTDDTRKYIFDGEVTVEKIKAFGETFLEDKLNPFYKSDPVPKNNDEDVKIVVGDNFDAIVLDESKDVLLELYAPWCGHCQALEPTYNKLAKHLRSVESIVIAKMDGTTNEHPKAKADGFPTILFYPAGKKSFDPIPVETERTVKDMYLFLREHASIPFKLQKTASEDDSNVTESVTGSHGDVKDEL